MAAVDEMAAVDRALTVFAAMDPSVWGTGLSREGAELALAWATAPLRTGFPKWPVDLTPPRRLVIWCAGNVFTAPLEWTATFAAAGAEVVLKAPSAVPAPVLALARCFSAQGLPVEAHDLPHNEAWHLLDYADAVLGFGSTSSMLSLEAHLGPGVRHALFGHRVSAAVVAGTQDVGLLIRDAVLHDGRGCKSPVAVFSLTDAEETAALLAQGLAEAAITVPRGDMAASWGPRWRRRIGLARILDHAHNGNDWAVPVLPGAWFEPEPLPRMLPVHPVQDLNEVTRILAGLPLGTCGTNLSAKDSLALHQTLGFPVVCPLGSMHATELDGWHEDTDVRAKLGEASAP
jgi:hypothetical protein